MRDPKGACVDATNCDYERWTVCAFDGQDVATQVKFLDCMDAPWDEPLTERKPVSCARNITGVDVGAMKTCFKGTRGDELLKEASQAFVKAFPKPTYMPQVTVDGTIVDADYDDVKKAVCEGGCDAPACK